MSDFMEIRPVRAVLFHADGQKERQAGKMKSVVAFLILQIRLRTVTLHDRMITETSHSLTGRTTYNYKPNLPPFGSAKYINIGTFHVQEGCGSAQPPVSVNTGV